MRVARLWCGALALIGGLVVATTTQLRPPPENLAAVAAGLPHPQVLARDGRPLSRSWVHEWNQYDQVRLDEVPELLTRAIILAEDQRFAEHGGLDHRARAHAVLQNLRAGRVVRGASTISEQVIRMLHPRPRTVWTRWLEGWEARQLERQASKLDILEFYLNQVPFAAQRRGIQQASRYYFGRDISTLNSKEVVALAVLVRSPVGMSPHQPGSRARLESRIAALEQRLVATGDLPAGALAGLSMSTPEAHALTAFPNFPTAVAAVRSQTGPTPAPVHSTLDLAAQHQLSALLHEHLNRLAERKVQHGAALLIHNDSGEVRAWVTATVEGIEPSHIDAVLVPRPPGSTLKPFVYAAAMARGWTPSTVLRDEPLEELVGEGLHIYHNFSRRHYGDVSLRDALGNSLNIPAIRAIRYVGVGEFIDFGRALGLTGLDYNPEHYGDGLAIGNAPLSLFELTRAYGVLARRGRALQPRLVAQHDDGVVPEQLIDPQVAILIGDILADQRARGREFGTNSVLTLPHQTAIKTGTSSNYRDAWTFAYNDSYTLGVWMGNLDFARTDGLTGSIGPAVVTRNMLDWLNRHRVSRPLQRGDRLVRHTVCVEDGFLAREGCSLRDEWFADWMEPGFRARGAISARILTPMDEAEYARDPRVSSAAQAIVFHVAEHESLGAVDWVLNGHEEGSSDVASFRWPLRPGHHRLQARLHYVDGTHEMTPEVRFRVY